MRVAVGADHAGYALKTALADHLRGQGIGVLDLGTNDDATPVDYPDFAASVARAVARGEADFGLLCCGTGIGMSIAANKVPGIRAAVVHDRQTAVLARTHNWANVLCLGGRLLAIPEAIAMLDAFLQATPEERHQGRIRKIGDLEEEARR